jgi:DNA topoisomerase-3
VDLDSRAADAVDARIELDLRIGAIFTRFQSLLLRPKFREIQQEKVLKFGILQSTLTLSL